MNFLSRAQVDLIDMRDQNLEANMSSDGVTPYKFLMVYIDHFTKKVNLVPLRYKSAEEVSERLSSDVIRQFFGRLGIFQEQPTNLFCHTMILL